MIAQILQFLDYWHWNIYFLVNKQAKKHTTFVKCIVSNIMDRNNIPYFV